MLGGIRVGGAEGIASTRARSSCGGSWLPGTASYKISIRNKHSPTLVCKILDLIKEEGAVEKKSCAHDAGALSPGSDLRLTGMR